MSEEKPGLMKEGIAAIWRHARPLKRQLTMLTVLGFVSSAANGFVPYVTGRFFDSLIALSKGSTSSIGALPLWAALLAAWAVVQFVANNIDWVMDRLRRQVDTKVHMNIQVEGFAHLFRLPLSYHKNSHMNGELQKISIAGWRVAAIVRNVITLAPQLLSICIGLALAASINGMLAGVLVVGVFLYALLLSRILVPAAKLDATAHRVWNEGWDDAASAVLQIESVKQATAEEYESNRVRDALLDRAYRLWYQLETIWSNVHFFQRTIVFFTQLTVFILSVRLVSGGTITVGELVALNGYALMFFGPFVSLGNYWQTIQNGIGSAARVEAIFRERQERYTPDGAVVIQHVKGEVLFDKVFFRYGAEQPEVLSNVSFGVEPGHVVAFVGESGVGKSTTISLISGYNFPSSGGVFIDDIDTRKLDLTHLRRHIAVVPQEIALFNDTIKANISYGMFEADDEAIERAAREAYVDEFVRVLPKGYETLVGERGIKLSVGQKQRVAIARAILRNPAILILDEPTSALDAKTERIVTTALERLMQGRTTFIIAHRLSTVRKANIILVFEKGTIVEQGSHQTLVKKKGGVYRHLYEYQIGLH